MASLDTRRPAAQEQLKVLGEQVGVATLPIVAGQTPLAIARRAMEMARLQGFDVVLLDTAGRLHIDEELMNEVVAVRDAVLPYETLLVVDAMTGQDAVNVARAFKDRVDVTGIVMTRIDGDARGGAALSMRAVTGCPIKFLGVGEKIDALEALDPQRLAGRILGMGDVVGLVEKATEAVDQAEAEKLAKKMQKGEFDLNDMMSQLRQLKRMGGLGGLVGMLPGAAQVKAQLANARVDESMLKRQEAIILSMTPRERRQPKIIGGGRRKRIAAGSGTTVQDVNKLLKQHQQMADMMKRVGKLGQKGLQRHGLHGLLPPGGGFR
jgi:signal recognition particle subunit SRP54